MILKNVENKENKTATFQVESDAAEFESAYQSIMSLSPSTQPSTVTGISSGAHVQPLGL